jgi:hypothetical protein
VYGAKWPNFTWINTDDVIYKGNYQHWGTYQPGRRLEPNNMVAPENCAGSNTTQGVLQPDKTTVLFDGLGGWADHNCREKYIFICEIEREHERAGQGSACGVPAGHKLSKCCWHGRAEWALSSEC